MSQAVKKYQISVVMLVLALLASNAWWAFRMLDAGISYTYQSASLESTSELLNQSLALLSVVTKPGITRNEVINAARLSNDTAVSSEKEGYVWVGQLGLKFNEQGRFIEAVTPSTQTTQ